MIGGLGLSSCEKYVICMEQRVPIKTAVRLELFWGRCDSYGNRNKPMSRTQNRTASAPAIKIHISN